jgi:cobalt-precorrin 5A hydrolase/precorrin-3B C17-methyltransferase
MALTPVVVALTASPVAARLAEVLGARLHARAGRAEGEVLFEDTAEHLRTLFAAGVPVVGVCAAGILIRAVAPLLSDKRAEPAVVAVAEDGSAVVPLLGGHRGANALARRIGEALGVPAAVTTAGDAAFGIALDEPPAGWRLAEPERAGRVMARLLAGEGARVTGEAAGEAGWLSGLPPGDLEIACTMGPSRAALRFAPQRVTLVVGCARGCAPETWGCWCQAALKEARVTPEAIAAVGTLIKADEGAVLQLARDPRRAAAALPMRRRWNGGAAVADLLPKRCRRGGLPRVARGRRWRWRGQRGGCWWRSARRRTRPAPWG